MLVEVCLLLHLMGYVAGKHISRCCYTISPDSYTHPLEVTVDLNRELNYVDPNDCKYEDVDALSARECTPTDGTYYCMQYLRNNGGGMTFYRGFAKKGEKTCSTVQGAVYCFECDSDLCNNANMWRPRERLFNNYDQFLNETYLDFSSATLVPWCYWLNLTMGAWLIFVL